MHGKEGTYTWKEGTYVGDYEKNKKHGDGTYTWKNEQESYKGKWKNGNQDGVGIITNLKDNKTK